MHGGIWTLCINLRDDEIRELGKKGFPAVSQCFNYLAGNMDNSRSGGSDEPRADWQHSESQTPIHPHLSRYNNNVSNATTANPRLNQDVRVLTLGVLSFPSSPICSDENGQTFPSSIRSFPIIFLRDC